MNCTATEMFSYNIRSLLTYFFCYGQWDFFGIHFLSFLEIQFNFARIFLIYYKVSFQKYQTTPRCQ